MLTCQMPTARKSRIPKYPNNSLIRNPMPDAFVSSSYVLCDVVYTGNHGFCEYHMSNRQQQRGARTKLINGSWLASQEAINVLPSFSVIFCHLTTISKFRLKAGLRNSWDWDLDLDWYRITAPAPKNRPSQVSQFGGSVPKAASPEAIHYREIKRTRPSIVLLSLIDRVIHARFSLSVLLLVGF